jgi:hypothetical protein
LGHAVYDREEFKHDWMSQLVVIAYIVASSELKRARQIVAMHFHQPNSGGSAAICRQLCQYGNLMQQFS